MRFSIDFQFAYRYIKTNIFIYMNVIKQQNGYQKQVTGKGESSKVTM